MGKSKKEHYTHQLQYFNTEFSTKTEYDLAFWQESYIVRIKNYLLDKDYKKKTLLDIATGSGYVAIEMAKLGMKVIACDLSPKSIKNLEVYKRKYKLTNLTLITCKAEEIPIQNKKIDYIVANAILEHIPDENKAIQEWKRLLKKNGKMFITVPLKFRYILPFLWLPNYIHDKKIGHLRRYDLEDLVNKFKLQVIQVFYTGHFVKIIGIVISIITKSNKYEKYFEILDSNYIKKRYGANNITVIFENEI